MYTDVESELLALVDFIETGLLPPFLAKRLAHFPPPQLHVALRDLLDWLSLRSILRGSDTHRTAGLSSRVHPLTGRVLGRLDALSNLLCAPDCSLAYRIEADPKLQIHIEDFVKTRIWHPYPHRQSQAIYAKINERRQKVA